MREVTNFDIWWNQDKFKGEKVSKTNKNLELNFIQKALAGYKLASVYIRVPKQEDIPLQHFQTDFYTSRALI